MSNKYLEKVASLFPSVKYHKQELRKEERTDYSNAYHTAGVSSFKNIGRAALASGAIAVGAGLGAVAGGGAIKPLAQAFARRAGNKAMAAGEGLQSALSKGVDSHRKVRAAGTLAGAFAGAIPGASYSDHFRHNHAKSVIEKKRKQHD